MPLRLLLISDSNVERSLDAGTLQVVDAVAPKAGSEIKSAAAILQPYGCVLSNDVFIFVDFVKLDAKLLNVVNPLVKCKPKLYLRNESGMLF